MSTPSKSLSSTMYAIAFTWAARNFVSDRILWMFAVSLHMTVGTTRTSFLRASRISLFQADWLIFAVSARLPSLFTEYAKGFTSVNCSMCLRAAAVPSVVLQYGIQPDTSSAAYACTGRANTSVRTRTAELMRLKMILNRMIRKVYLI